MNGEQTALLGMCSEMIHAIEQSNQQTLKLLEEIKKLLEEIRKEK